MTVDDVISTLHLMDMIVKNSQGQYVIRINVDSVRQAVKHLRSKGFPRAKMELLQWSPSPFKRALLHNQLLIEGTQSPNNAVESALEKVSRAAKSMLRHKTVPMEQ